MGVAFYLAKKALDVRTYLSLVAELDSADSMVGSERFVSRPLRPTARPTEEALIKALHSP
jgi:hypothetical protein